MKHKMSLIGAAALLALGTAAAQAEPQSGFSVNGGLTSSSSTGNYTLPPPGPVTYSSSGLSLGIDYQIALNQNLSLNPFLMLSGESGGGSLTGTNVSHNILGLQLRYWAGDMFVGGHIGSYTEVVTDPFTQLSITGSGGGFGLVGGWENPVGGLYVMGQFDHASINYVDAALTMNAFRMSVGYRWK